MPAMQSWVVKYTAHIKEVPESLKMMSTEQCLHMWISPWHEVWIIQPNRAKVLFTLYFFFPAYFQKFQAEQTFLSFPDILNKKYFGKREVCPKQQGQSDGSTGAAPWGAGWRQHSRAGAQGPAPGAAAGQGRGLVLLSSQVSDSPWLHRDFPREVSVISPFQTFLSCK